MRLHRIESIGTLHSSWSTCVAVADVEGGPWGLCRMYVACLLKLFIKMAYCI